MSQSEPEFERPTLVLVWPDGTVILDSPASTRESPLVIYLTQAAYGYVSEPLANVYAVDPTAKPTDPSPLGMPLRQVKITQVDRFISPDDWIEILYEVRWIDDPGAATEADKPLASLSIRIDGRA